ncbi:hypothetical protein JL720_14662 [Aureococcus anophagefferens]|nr:hypothetical protein JL720_14662 [Aureococcus anophagefferens]
MDHGSHRTTGHLLKKGGSRTKFGRRNWKKRWFVLDLERGACPFKDASCALQGEPCPAGRHRPTGDELLNYFELRGVLDDAGAPRSKPFKLRALGGDELFEWLQSLKASLALVRGARRPRAAAADAADASGAAAATRQARDELEEEEGYSSPDDDDYPSARVHDARVADAPHPAPRPDVDEAARLRHSLTSQEAAHAAAACALWDRVESSEDGTAPSPRGSSIHDGAAPAAWAPARAAAAAHAPRASLPEDEAPADEEPPAPQSPRGRRGGRRRRSAARRGNRRSSTASWSCRVDGHGALEAAVDAALACGISFEAEEMVAARTRLQFLSATDDARSLLIKALDKDPDTKSSARPSPSRCPRGSTRTSPRCTRARPPASGQAGDPAISALSVFCGMAGRSCILIVVGVDT